VFHIFETYGSATLRFLILQGHYRRPFDFAPQAFESAKKALDKLLQAIIEYGDMDLIPITAENDLLAMPLPAECVNMRREFCNSMDNDFNSGAAMGHMFSMLKLVKNMNNEDRSQVMQVIQQMNYILGITNPKLLNQYKEKLAHAASGGNDKFEAVMRLLIECRQRARINKDFELSDHIRDELQKAGLVLLDGKDGTSWEQKD
jgi:cysteinyl-tRNA synthetase